MKTFAMTPQMILSFCRSHDWGKEAFLKDGMIRNLKDFATDKTFSAKADFSGYRQIREWAGY